MIIKVGKLPKVNSDKPSNDGRIEYVDVLIRKLGSTYIIDTGGVPTITAPPANKDFDEQLRRARKLISRNKGTCYKTPKYANYSWGSKIVDSEPVNPPQKDYRRKPGVPSKTAEQTTTD